MSLFHSTDSKWFKITTELLKQCASIEEYAFLFILLIFDGINILIFFQTIMKLGSYLKSIKVLTLIVISVFFLLSLCLDREHREWGRMERLHPYNNRGRQDITFD